LAGTGILSEIDGMALGNLCESYATLIAAQKLMAKQIKAGGSGLLVKTASGYIMQSPLLQIINKQTAIVNQQLKEFGLNPSSRTRIEANIGLASMPGGIDVLEMKLCGP
jgi:P27 family predicted phage terminase small subunit